MRCIFTLQYKKVFLLFFLIGELLLIGELFPSTVLARTHSSNDNGCTITPTTTGESRPDKSSLLVVMLDRSGSLIDPPQPTDPYRLSTSVTRALTDLWPGKMAVITFPQVNPLIRDHIQQLGPVDLTDATQLSRLKNSIPEADPDGNTPLGPAMDTTLQLLPRPLPSGSRGILITDGAPNTSTDPKGTQEMQHIEQDLLPQFQQLGFPISTFGLKIASNSSEEAFLKTVAHVSGGSYTRVASASELAQSVMQLDANWSGQQFYCASSDIHNNYGVSLNEFTKQATIIVFRSDDSYPIAVHDPKGNMLTSGIGVTQSSDVHYQIDKLDVTPPVLPGTYTVSVNKDPGAQVYWLVTSRLQVHINAPSGTVTPGPIHIAAVLYDDNKLFQPRPGATLQAVLSFSNGHTTPSREINLIQQGNDDLFSAETPPYGVGTLRIQILANYEEIHMNSEEQRIEIQIPWYQNPLVIILVLLSLLIVIALVVLFRVWRNLPGPQGVLVNVQNHQKSLLLGSHRSLLQSLWHKSIISTKELRHHPNGISVLASLIEEPLSFVFTHEGVILRLTASSSRISITREDKQALSLDADNKQVLSLDINNKEIHLQPRDIICKGDLPVVYFR